MHQNYTISILGLLTVEVPIKIVWDVFEEPAFTTVNRCARGLGSAHKGKEPEWEDVHVQNLPITTTQTLPRSNCYHWIQGLEHHTHIYTYMHILGKG